MAAGGGEARGSGGGAGSSHEEHEAIVGAVASTSTRRALVGGMGAGLSKLARGLSTDVCRRSRTASWRGHDDTRRSNGANRARPASGPRGGGRAHRGRGGSGRSEPRLAVLHGAAAHEVPLGVVLALALAFAAREGLRSAPARRDRSIGRRSRVEPVDGPALAQRSAALARAIPIPGSMPVPVLRIRCPARGDLRIRRSSRLPPSRTLCGPLRPSAWIPLGVRHAPLAPGRQRRSPPGLIDPRLRQESLVGQWTKTAERCLESEKRPNHRPHRARASPLPMDRAARARPARGRAAGRRRLPIAAGPRGRVTGSPASSACASGGSARPRTA